MYSAQQHHTITTIIVKNKKRARDPTAFCISNNKLACNIHKKRVCKDDRKLARENSERKKKEEKKRKMTALISE